MQWKKNLHRLHFIWYWLSRISTLTQIMDVIIIIKKINRYIAFPIPISHEHLIAIFFSCCNTQIRLLVIITHNLVSYDLINILDYNNSNMIRANPKIITVWKRQIARVVRILWPAKAMTNKCLCCVATWVVLGSTFKKCLRCKKTERQPWNLKLFFSEENCFPIVHFLSTLDLIFGFHIFVFHIAGNRVMYHIWFKTYRERGQVSQSL